MAGVQAAAQTGDIRLGEAGQHLRLQRGYPVPVAVEQFPAAGSQGDHQAAAVGPVAVPLDQAASFQRGDHVGHGLSGDERGARELRGGEVGVTFQYGERRVLKRGETGRPQQVVQVGPDSQFDLLDEVEQHWLGSGGRVRGRADGARRSGAFPGIWPGPRRHADTKPVISICRGYRSRSGRPGRRAGSALASQKGYTLVAPVSGPG